MLNGQIFNTVPVKNLGPFLNFSINIIIILIVVLKIMIQYNVNLFSVKYNNRKTCAKNHL